MDKVIELAYELKSLIALDERVIELNKNEEIMNNDNLAMSLAYKKDLAVDEYEFAINHFKDNSNEVMVAQKKLHEAKLNLDTCESVRNYLKSYSKVRDLYLEINNILFSILNLNLKEGRN